MKKETGNPTKRVSVIIAWVLIVLFLIAAIALILRFTNNGTDTFKTFYVERDGKIFATTDSTTVESDQTVRFDVKYTFDFAMDEKKDFSVKVVSNAPEGNAFRYKVNGISCTYQSGMDMTAAFSVEKNTEEGYFTIKAPVLMSEVLEVVQSGTVELEQEPDLSEEAYFKILVTSYNGKSTIMLSVLIKLGLSLDHEQVVL